MGISVEEATEHNRQQWDSFCDDNLASYAQYWCWHNTLGELGFIPISLLARDRYGNILGLLRAAILKMPLHRYAISTHGDGRMCAGPLSKSRDVAALLFQRFDEMCVGERVAKAIVLLGALGNQDGLWRKPLLSSGFNKVEKHKCTFILDLQRGPGQILASLSPNQRNQIRKGKKKGLTIKIAKNKEDIAAYF